MSPREQDQLGLLVARSIARFMRWPDDRVPDLAEHVFLIERGGETFGEFRWSVGVVESGAALDDRGFEVFAENVAAEMKEQRARFGVVLPWDLPTT